MAAVQVTSSGANSTFPSSVSRNRLILRNSSGIPYVILTNTDSGQSIEVWKGNSATPTSFSQQDSANNPSSVSYDAPAAAIDSTGKIHITFDSSVSMATGQRYVVFDTATDTFTSDTLIYSYTPNGLGTMVAIAIDANDVPHIILGQYNSNMGTSYSTVMYGNRVGGSWNTLVQVEGASAQKNCNNADITIDNNNIPVISYVNITDADLTLATGNANNATSFTLLDLDTSVSTASPSLTSIAVDGSNTVWVAAVDSDNSMMVYENTTQHDAGATGVKNPSIVVVSSTEVYVFYEDTNNDIAYDKWNGSSWAGSTVLETGTFNGTVAKWANWVDFNSSGANAGLPPGPLTYYFNASDGGPTDANAVFSGDANAFDGSTSTFASSSTAGDTTSNFLQGDGTNAPASLSNTITQVRARVYTANSSGGASMNAAIYTDGLGELLGTPSGNQANPTGSYGGYVTLSTPTGGWTWTKVSNLEVKLYKGGAGASVDVARVEVEVTYDSAGSRTTLDYAYTDETASPDVFWNLVSLSVSTLSVNVSDTVNITESVTMLRLSFISVFDQINITENVTLERVSFISVFDNINITESISIEIFNNITVSDQINITESVTVENPTGFTSVFDQINITENVTLEVVSFVSVSEQVNITENIQVERVNNINVSDQVNITETVQIDTQNNINVFDSITITENVQLERVSFISVFDQVNITESVQLERVSFISVFDQVNITESVTLEIVSFVAVFDQINITENTTLELVSFISVSDQINTTESVTISNPTGFTSVFDVINITENISTVASMGDINVADNIETTEVVEYYKDIIYITENTNVSLQSHISVFDQINITESVTMLLLSFISVNDNINITESVTVENPTGYTSVVDNITITENIVVENPFGHTSVFDSITILEGPAFDQLSQGPEAPNTTATQAGSGGSNVVGWNNPDNAKVDDGAYVTATGAYTEDPVVSDTNILKLTNFGFSLPSVGTVITGIKVTIKKKSSHDSGGNFVTDYRIVLNKADDTEGGTDHADGSTHWSTSDQYVDYGGASDDWGLTLTASDVNNSNFGVRIRAKTTNNSTAVTASIDYVEVTIFYYVQGYPKVELYAFINVVDNVSITENVSISITSGEPDISVFDSINITESVTMLLLSFISVNDNINITESVTVENPTGYTSVFDDITITESVTMLLLSFISVNDNINITESVTVENPTGFLSVVDTINITENVNVTLVHNISVSDQVNITENVTVEIPLSVSVFDQVNITESVTMLLLSFISVNDNINITESVTVENTTGYTSVVDNITITENVTLLLQSFINVNDNINITENVTLELVSFISVSDQISITESVTMLLLSFISVNDNINITESVTIENLTGYTSVVDNITVTENTTLELVSFIFVNDNVNITESVTVENPTGFLSVFDLINITEDVTIVRNDPGTFGINVSDQINITESVTVENPTGFTSVIDNITITESVTLLLQSFINVNDNITITDIGTPEVVAGFINVFDSINITESVTVELQSFISVSDQVNITENLSKASTLFISVFDSINITENITLLLQSFINVSDQVNITENIVIFVITPSVDLNITISDLISITENLTIVNPIGDINVFDSINITENLTRSNVFSISVISNILITESVSMESFRFSPSSGKPIGRGRNIRPVGKSRNLKPVGSGQETTYVGEINNASNPVGHRGRSL